MPSSLSVRHRGRGAVVATLLLDSEAHSRLRSSHKRREVAASFTGRRDGWA
ncbi:hypothetical protein [Streptomyces sp. NPDC007025]|uniref:hypothetical protein n=1 Tax=unclassified Streptomyces TaxID=2593676 RepID=UPI0036B9FFBD